MSLKCKCPVCKGTGELEAANATDWRQKAVKVLHKEGFGVRQIQRLLSYKNVNSVSAVLKKK